MSARGKDTHGFAVAENTSQDPFDRLVWAKRSETPDELTLLARDPDPTIRQAALTNTKVPLEALHAAATDPEVDIRIGLVKNRRTPEDTLVLLASDTDVRVRRALIAHAANPRQVLEVLAQDEDPVIRATANQRLRPAAERPSPLAIATNGSHTERLGLARESRLFDDLPEPVLRILAHDPSHLVREATALCRDLPEDLLHELAHDPSGAVRYVITINNHPLPVSVLDALLHDPDPVIVEAAQRRRTRDET